MKQRGRMGIFGRTRGVATRSSIASSSRASIRSVHGRAHAPRDGGYVLRVAIAGVMTGPSELQFGPTAARRSATRILAERLFNIRRRITGEEV